MHNDIIEKAKWNVGDEKTDKNGNVWVCGGFNAKGTPLWRAKTKSAGGNKPAPAPAKSKQPQSQGAPAATAAQSTAKLDLNGKSFGDLVADMTPNEIISAANSATTAQLESAVNDKKNGKDLRQLVFNVLKKRSDYDKSKVDSSDLTGGHIAKPKAKVQYKTKRPLVEIPELKDWEINNKGHRLKVTISMLRSAAAKDTDDELLKKLNNTSPGYDWRRRQVAYDEAAARGIDESKIDVSGTLQKQWDKLKRDHDRDEAMNAPFDEDTATELKYDWAGFGGPEEAEAFMQENFPDGDLEWLDPKSERVKSLFKTATLAGRKKYDTFKDYFQRDPQLVPGYLNAINKCNNLNGEYDEFINNDSKCLFVSAGGAGAGKSFGFKEVAKDSNCPELEPGDDPNDADWGWVQCSDQDAEDDKAFCKTLAKYNGTYIDDDGEEHGHILVFDDADKILTTKSKPLIALMKKINDGDPRARVFTNPDTGQTEVWKGRIMIMTNKSIEQINSDEDKKAITSRGIVSDIQFTRNETLELLEDRYKDMNLNDCKKVFRKQHFTPQEIEDFRDDVMDYMRDHVTDADPAKFTPRAFLQLCTHIAPKWKGGSGTRKAGKVTVGTDVPWEISALSIIKAEDNEIEKADKDDINEQMIATKKHLEERMAQAKKNGTYDKIFGRKAQDAIIFGEDVTSDDNSEDDETEDNDKKGKKRKSMKKALTDDLGMTLDQAESLLLG